MGTPIILFTNGCNIMEEPKIKDNGTLNTGAKIYLLVAVIDAMMAVTFLVIGILGTLSVITLPIAASYTFIGLSCALIVSWIAATVVTKGASYKLVYEFLSALCSS